MNLIGNLKNINELLKNGITDLLQNDDDSSEGSVKAGQMVNCKDKSKRRKSNSSVKNTCNSTWPVRKQLCIDFKHVDKNPVNNPDYDCLICETPCDTNAICCDGCNAWIHYKCEKLSKKEINELKTDDSSLYTCKSCNDLLMIDYDNRSDVLIQTLTVDDSDLGSNTSNLIDSTVHNNRTKIDHN